LATAFFAQTASAEINLTFGTYTADKATETVKQFKPFLSYLSTKMTAELGETVNINMKVTKSYEASIQDLVDSGVDFSRFGPASYVTAKTANENIKLIAIESENGEKTFKGVIAVHSDSPMKSLSDLKGKSFAFGNELSTIGRYLAQQFLLDAGIKSTDLARYEYLGRHDKVGSAVSNGSFQAGALKSSTFEKLQSKGEPIRMLVDFDNVTKPWIAAENIDPRILVAMRKVMMENPDAPEIKSLAKSGFLAGEDSDYDIIRVAMTRSEQF
jgi:phosphonate transport system substrate-binding protein